MDGATLALSERLLAAYLLALARAGAFVMVAPPFSARNVPARARVSLAIALALPLSALAEPAAPALDSASMLLRSIAEVFVGATLGFFVVMAVATVQVVGELLDHVGGFTMTTALDPLLMAQNSVMGRLHQLTAVTVLFVSGGHLVVLHGLSRTVQMGPTVTLSAESVTRAVTRDVASLFLGAIQIAAPMIAAMLVADVALGLITRAAPAMNPFALGFPLKILFTLLLAGLVLAQVPQALSGTIDHAVGTVLELVREASGGG